VLGALAVGTFVLAACGSDDEATTTTAGGSDATAAAPDDSTGATTGATTGGTSGDGTATTMGGGEGGQSDSALVIARGMDVNSLDPALAYCDTCQIYLTAVYETLIGLAEDNQTLVPRLATEWTSNPEQTQFTFTLDQTATFADGTPVTSADVKFSWERLQALEGGASYLVGGIETIETPDEHTVIVNLVEPNSAFLAQVNAPYLGITNSKLAQENGATTDLESNAGEDWFLENSAGSGPFQLAAYTQGNELRLLRNDAYWGTPANFPEVIIRETVEAVTQRQQLEEGEVDIAMQISNDVAAGMGGDDVIVEQVPSFNYVYLALSPGAAGGEQLTPEVREAIRLALDYDGLIDVTVGGAGQKQASPIPNGFAGTSNLPEPQQDLDAARKLLADAGVTELTLDATYPSLNVYGVDFSTAMQKIQTDLEEIGITLELNPIDITVWADRIGAEGIPVTMVYFAPDHTDSSQYLQYFGMIPDSAWLARSGLDPVPEQSELLSQAFGEQDPAARDALYEQLAELMIADHVIIPVVNPNLFLAYRSDITGLYYSACCNLVLAQLGRSAG